MHNSIYDTDEAKAYLNNFNAECRVYFGATSEVKAAYLHEHVDKAKLYEIDLELFNMLLVFYDNHILEQKQIQGRGSSLCPVFY